MVACLERTDGNAEFHQIFWATSKSKTVNDVKQIHATVDSKTVTHTPRRAKRGRDTEIPQSSGPPKKVSDEAVYTGKDDRVVRAATTATSLEVAQESGSGPRCQATTLGDADAQTRFENASKQSHDPPISEVNTSRSREDNIEHQDDLTNFVPPTPHDSPLSGGSCLGTLKDCSRLGDQKAVKESQKIRKDTKDTINAGGAVNTTTTTGVSVASAPMRTEKAKKKEVAFRDVEEPKRSTPSPNLYQKIKAKNLMIFKQGWMQIALLAARLQEEERENFSIDEQARFLVDTIEERKRFFSAQMAEQIRNKPLTKTQLRNKMITFLKNMGRITYNQLKNKSLEEIQKLYEREQKWINDFVPTDSEMVKDSGKKDDDNGKEAKSSKKQAKSSKKRPREEHDEERDEIAINVESLTTKYPIVDWKTHILTEHMIYYQIIRAGRDSNNYKIFNEMIEDFDKQDVVDLKTLFEPCEEDEVWRNQQDYNLISWRLFDSCRVYVFLMDTGIAIHMIVEKKYPLTQEMLSRMLNRRLEVDQEREMAFELIRFIKAHLKYLLEKWLTFPQGLRNTNHTQTLDLADIYGSSAISTAFFFNNVIQDFQENSNDEVDERSSEEYIRDLELEYHERALLANSKRFIKRRNNFSGLKVNENTECYKCGKKSSSNLNNQADQKFQRDYKAEYKKMKAKLALLEASPSNSQNPKTFQPKNKGLVAKTFYWDVEEVTQVKVLMALADDELTLERLMLVMVNGLTSSRESYALQEKLKEEKKINEKWLTSSKKVSQCISEQIPYQKTKVLGGELLTESSSKKNKNENLSVHASMGYDQEMVLKTKD
ncbi:hypothetical protein Tco_0660912 [Tanacetum coccineum]